MKKYFLYSALLVFAAALFTLTSCTKADIVVFDKLDDFSTCLNYTQYDGTTYYYFALPKTSITNAFAAAGATYNPSRIKAMKVSKFSAEVTTTGATFNDIAGFEVYIRGASTSGDSVQVAWVGNIPNNATQKDMTANGTELKQLLNEDNLVFILRVSNKNGSGTPICMKLTGGEIQVNVRAD